MYTSVEQSKNLLELGLSPESADMYYLRIVGETYDKYGELISLENNLCKVEIDSPNRLDYPEDDILPCWSVGALLELMPKKIKKGDEKLPFHLFQFKDTWGVQYGYPNETEYAVLIENKTPLEAAYNMVVWLLENNYISK